MTFITFSLRLESKINDTLKHELEDVKKKLSTMSAESNRLKSNVNQLEVRDREQRSKINELTQLMTESAEKIRAASKERVTEDTLALMSALLLTFINF